MLLLGTARVWAADSLDVEAETQAKLAKVRRVYVDLLTGGESAMRIRDMLITSLQGSHLFLLTEDESKADAVLKGAGQDTAFMEHFSSNDSINAHSQISLPTTGETNAKYSNRSSAGLTIGEHDSRNTEERKHEAIATVRLVTKDGDVIWSTTQESLGAKFLGASADVADKVSKKLSADVHRARLEKSGAPPVPVSAHP